MASGTTKLKKLTDSGMMTMKIITVACIVNIWLNRPGPIRSLSAEANCMRITPASTPAIMRKAKAVAP